MKFVHAFVIHA